MFVYTQRPLIGPEGFIILENVVVEGEAPDGFARFVCRGESPALRKPDGQTVMARVEVAVPAADIQEAFALAPGVLEGALKAAKQRAISSALGVRPARVMR